MTGTSKLTGLYQTGVHEDEKKRFRVVIDNFNIVDEDLELDKAIAFLYHGPEPFGLQYDLDCENFLIFIQQIVYKSNHTSISDLQLHNWISYYMFETDDDESEESSAETQHEGHEDDEDNEDDEDEDIAAVAEVESEEEAQFSIVKLCINYSQFILYDFYFGQKTNYLFKNKIVT